MIEIREGIAAHIGFVMSAELGFSLDECRQTMKAVLDWSDADLARLWILKLESYRARYLSVLLAHIETFHSVNETYKNFRGTRIQPFIYIRAHGGLNSLALSLGASRALTDGCCDLSRRLEKDHAALVYGLHDAQTALQGRLAGLLAVFLRDAGERCKWIIVYLRARTDADRRREVKRVKRLLCLSL